MSDVIKFGASLSQHGWHPVINADGEVVTLRIYFKTKEEAGEYAKNFILKISGVDKDEVKFLTPEEIKKHENF